MFIVAVQ